MAVEVQNGVVEPPPNVRRDVEVAAKAVWKSQDPMKLIDKMLARNPARFSFLQSSDPYYTCYKKALDDLGPSPRAPEPPAVEVTNDAEAAQGGDQPPVAVAAAQKEEVRKPSAAVPGVETTEKAPEISKIKAAEAKAKASKPVPTEPPPAEQFAVLLPTPAPTNMEMEVIRLTAQFTACCGRPFLAGVNVREYRNPQFGFLKPEHAHHLLFQTLISMYQQVMKPSDELRARMEKLSLKRTAIRDEVTYRVDWEQMKEHEASKNADDERLQMQLIDWHDFVVVETIELDEGEESLPVPVAPDPAVLARTREAVAAKQAAKAKAAADAATAAREDNDVDMDDGAEAANVSVADPAADIPSNMIRRDYVPKLGTRQPASSNLNVVLPSGQTVPVSEASASMKAELLDPKYKEERQRAADKNRLQNLATDDEIARNLGRLNDAKTEVFDRVDLQEALHQRQIAAPAQNPSSLPDAAPSQTVEAPAPRPANMQSQPSAPYVMPYANAAAANTQPPPEKKPRLGEDESATANGGLVPEEEWIAKHGDNVQVHVKAPTHSNKEWDLQGQTISLQVPLKATVGALKATLAQLTHLPSNKQKLQVDVLGFLKDSQTLASYNIGKDATVVLEVKERGKKKK
mmetsp:Transcript_3194/g.9737  ORF Transcript_3194/g.9737 Transcript_3194/m.9737 type:complete len:631 (+) Transcript_3194:145-2037(+)